MDFVLWVCRVMHVVSVVVWLGGLIFINAMMTPVVEYHQATRSAVVLGVYKRFLPFIWSSLWSLAITGLLLMVLSPRFIWFEYSTSWSQLLFVKQIIFVLWLFVSWQTKQVYAKVEQSVDAGHEEFEGWRFALIRLVRRGIVLGIVSMLCAAGMMVV